MLPVVYCARLHLIISRKQVLLHLSGWHYYFPWLVPLAFVLFQVQVQLHAQVGPPPLPLLTVAAHPNHDHHHDRQSPPHDHHHATTIDVELDGPPVKRQRRQNIKSWRQVHTKTRPLKKGEIRVGLNEIVQLSAGLVSSDEEEDFDTSHSDEDCTPTLDECPPDALALAPETSGTPIAKSPCKCGCTTHSSTIDKNCPLSKRYSPVSNQLGYRGCGRGPDREKIKQTLLKRGVDVANLDVNPAV